MMPVYWVLRLLRSPLRRYEMLYLTAEPDAPALKLNAAGRGAN